MTAENPPEGICRIIARIAPGWPPVLDVGPGWFALLAHLDERLSTIAPEYVVHQVKSKFGSLSFYAQASEDPWSYNDDFHAAIRAAEWESLGACEECGAPARTYTIRRWVWTVCPAHAAEKRA